MLVRARFTLRAIPSIVTAPYPPRCKVLSTAATTSISMRSSRGRPTPDVVATFPGTPLRPALFFRAFIYRSTHKMAQ
jgi:hypothetical protein